MKERIIKMFILAIVISMAILAAWQLKEQNHVITETITDETIQYCTSIDISAKDIYHHISILASDSLEGRNAGTEGEAKAARYIREKFMKLGLKCFPGGYDQPFSFEGRPEFRNCSLTFGDFKGVFGVDFRSGIVTDSLKASGEVVFLGYGYRDDYKNVDVKGRWVLVLEGERLSSIVPKATQNVFKRYEYAKANGAAGVLSISIDNQSKGQYVPQGYRMFGYKSIPLFSISQNAADCLLKHIGMTTLEVLDKMKGGNHWHVSIPVTVAGAICMKRDFVYSRNVFAYLEGNDSILKKEYIVVGAHYDHVGTRVIRTASGDSLLIYNGADDNASGVAGLLELAEKQVSENRLKRSVIFAAFGAEEQGLKGSFYFCDHMPIDYKKIALMVNMDMIGRMDSMNRVYVNTVVPNTALDAVVEKLSANHPGINLVLAPTKKRNTDYAPFYDRNVPIASFTTGIHDQYHTPGDTLGTINYIGEKLILELVDNLMVAKADTIPSRNQKH